MVSRANASTSSRTGSTSPNTIGRCRRPSGLPAGRRFITTIARFHPVKDHATLIRAFAKIAARFPDVDLLLAGEGPLKHDLESLAATLKVTDRVRFLGVRRDVPALLKATTIFALTSVSEGASLTVLEAMAAGRPIVLTDVGGNPELVRRDVDGLLAAARRRGGHRAGVRDAARRSRRSRPRLGDSAARARAARVSSGSHNRAILRALPRAGTLASMNESLKSVARGLAFVAISPMLLWFVVKRAVLGPDRALQGSAQALALVPGLPGQYVRRAFLSVAIARCAPTSVVEFGVTFSAVGRAARRQRLRRPVLQSRPRAPRTRRAGRRRRAHPERRRHACDGARRHGDSRAGRHARAVRVGQGTWIGNGAIVMADIGRDCVIGAGAVVTTAIPDRSVAVGVPARVIRVRGES